MTSTSRHTEAPAAHQHEWQLLEVEFEDGHATRVFGCTGCPQEQLRL
ncbi:hypothetical protein GCM10023340_09880 [Nocardioides marinquilinus]|uniref:Uncharacterized protein n=1 Tax=Nocardioides marinquilinus TaxID=1210400 RepID=A0ABP9PEC7_9ACTN